MPGGGMGMGPGGPMAPGAPYGMRPGMMQMRECHSGVEQFVCIGVQHCAHVSTGRCVSTIAGLKQLACLHWGTALCMPRLVQNRAANNSNLCTVSCTY
jgi:hypothetical protein